MQFSELRRDDSVSQYRAIEWPLKKYSTKIDDFSIIFSLEKFFSVSIMFVFIIQKVIYPCFYGLPCIYTECQKKLITSSSATHKNPKN